MVVRDARFPIVEIIHSLSAKTVLPHLDKIFSIFGWFKHFYLINHFNIGTIS